MNILYIKIVEQNKAVKLVLHTLIQ